MMKTKWTLFIVAILAMAVSCGKDEITLRKEEAAELNEQNAGEYRISEVSWSGDAVDLDGDGKRQTPYEEFSNYFRVTGMDENNSKLYLWPEHHSVEKLYAYSGPLDYSCRAQVNILRQVVIQDPETKEIFIPEWPSTYGVGLQVNVLFFLGEGNALSPDLSRFSYTGTGIYGELTYIDTVESAQLSNGTLRVTVSGRFYDMSSKEFVRTGYEVHLSRVGAGKNVK